MGAKAVLNTHGIARLGVLRCSVDIVWCGADECEYEVERILDSKIRYRKLHYHVQWAGYNCLRTTWEPAANLENAQQLLDEFHAANPRKPR